MPKAKTVADFRNIHDRTVVAPKLIRAALEAMRKEGAENWEYDNDFMRRAGISNQEGGIYREQFKDHIVETTMPGNRKHAPRRVWFADVKVAAKIREQLNG